MVHNIFYQNTTDQPVTFILYLNNEISTEDSYSTVWHKVAAQKGDKLGPIFLSPEMQVTVKPLQKGLLIILLF